jgi:hypothetical protein
MVSTLATNEKFQKETLTIMPSIGEPHLMGKKKRGIEANLVKVRHQGASHAFTLTIALKNKGKTTNMFLQSGIIHYL